MAVGKKKDTNITSVKVSSRRSTQMKKEFFTFECCLEASTEGMTMEDVNKELNSLWEKASNQVDKQLLSTGKSMGLIDESEPEPED